MGFVYYAQLIFLSRETISAVLILLRETEEGGVKTERGITRGLDRVCCCREKREGTFVCDD